MKPKEWLLKEGHIKEITRGRMSRESIALIEDAVRNGAKIDGFSVSTAPVDSKEPAKVEKVATDPNRILEIPDSPFRDESTWEAYGNIGGKVAPIGMRTVEETCGNSLTYCACRNPMVRHLDSDGPVLVNFKARTKPLSNKRW